MPLRRYSLTQRSTHHLRRVIEWIGRTSLRKVFNDTAIQKVPRPLLQLTPLYSLPAISVSMQKAVDRLQLKLHKAPSYRARSVALSSELNHKSLDDP